MTEENEISPEAGEGLPVEAGAEEGVVTEGNSEGSIAERLKIEAEANYDKYIRAVAELENFKKRSIKERSELIKYAGEHLGRDLLDIVDNFDRAVQQFGGDQSDPFFQGVKMILSGLQQTLERHSIKGESALGKQFDPQKHEALASVPTSEKAPGTVMEEFRKAYFFKDKLLRAGQVVVAIQPAETVTPAEESAPTGEGDEVETDGAD